MDGDAVAAARTTARRHGQGMAADRTHDTQDLAEGNDLAASTVDLAAWLRPHLQTIGIALAVIAGGAVAWTLIAAQREAAAERSWCS